MKSKEWTPLERGNVEHKWYCSDGDEGELAVIGELKGKTVLVSLFVTNVTAPPAVGLPISPVPSRP